MRLLIAAVALCFASSSWAESKVVTWTNATKNTDGTTIPATGTGSLTKTTVEYGTCTGSNTFGTKAGEIFVAAPATTLTVNLVVVQMYCLRAFHTNTFGVASDFSNVAVTSVAPPKPAPPSALTVNASDLTAYGISQTPDRLTTFPVGTVAANTTCDGATSVNGLYRVPRDAVTWAGTVKPAVVFSACSGF